MRDFKLPDPGEGLTEADIVTWRVAVGDTVKVHDIVVEVETAKSLVELPIPYAGTVAALLVAEGDTVEVGTPIITIDDGSSAPAAANDGSATDRPAPASAPSPAVAGGQAGSGEAGGPTALESNSPTSSVDESDADKKPERTAVLVGYGVKQTEAKRRPRRKQNLLQTIAHYPDEEPAVRETTAHADASSWVGELVAAHSTHVLRDRRPLTELTNHSPEALARARVLAKPPVRKLAKDLGVDLVGLRGSGDDGTITREDVLAASRGGAPTATGGPTGSGAPAAMTAAPAGGGAEAGGPHTTGAAGPYSRERGEERAPIKGVRKVTAAAMVSSAFTAPHVSEWVEVDVTATMELVERLKRDKEFRDVKVTPLLVLAKAMCLAVRRNPGVNATWDEVAQEIVVKHYVNLGIAAATPRGLLVPNIKDADLLSMRDLGAAINALTETAREGRTQPAEMAGGTITITNVGVFGVDAGTPIINPGESAILAFGSITRKPWVVGRGDDERIEPRWVTTLTLSFDHRLVDGELGSRYLADVAAILADPAKGLVWG